MKLVDLVPIKEIDFNDPALMRARAAKDQMNQRKSNPRIGFDQALDLRGEKKDLELRINNLYREMESDPDVEAEGGPVADQYGDELNRLETRLYKINKEISSYDMSEGEDEDDEQDMADVKDDIASMMNESEDKWNAIDVSRKAEKEIGNKEWNSRTTAKLDMLKALNKAGKFKKDFSDERLQGWVDQNYSWEKLSRQFKLDESYSAMYNESYNNLNIANVSSMSETMQQGEYTAIEQGWDGLTPNERKDIIGDAMSGEARPNDMEKSFDQLKSEIPDFESIIANYLGIDEGSCGYGPNGEPGDTPGETRGMPADDRTLNMMREIIKKEIKKIAEEDSLDDKLRGALGDKDFEKVISKPVPSFADMIKPKPSKDKK